MASKSRRNEKRNPNNKRSLLTCLRKPHWMDFFYIGSVIIIIQILLLSILTLFPMEAQSMAETLHEKVTLTPQPKKNDAPSELSHGKDGNWLWDNHSQRPLAPHSNKAPKNKPDIFIDLLNEQATQRIKKTQIYIKSFALDHFDGTRWSIHHPSKFTIKKGTAKEIPLQQRRHPSLPTHRFRITQTHHHDGQNVFCAVQNALSTEINSLSKVSTDTYLLPSLGSEDSAHNYIATSQPLNFNTILKLDSNLSPGKTDSVYLSKVTDYKLQENISNLSATITEKLNTTDTLTSIRKLIRKQCKYSLKIRNSKKLNPLDNFLFHERVGYCEHFATATAMICRDHGIPSRIAYGWTGGKHFVDSNLFVFLAKNAHAWTEIYLQGYGWVIFDTTPVANIQTNQNSVDPAPDNLSRSLNYAYNDHDSDSDASSHQQSSLWNKPIMLPLKILGFGSLLTTLILIIRRFTTTSRTNYASSHLSSSPPKYLQLFHTLSANLGHYCKSGTTLAHNISKLKEQTPEQDHAHLDQLLTYHYNTTYRNTPPCKTTESSLVKKLKAEILKNKE